MARTKIPRGSVEEEGLFYFDHEPYQDRGCPDGKHPSCFNCPLEVCRYEAESPARRMRDERIVSAVDAGADINAVAAEQGVSRRTVFRVRAAEGRAAVTAQQAELGDAFERLGAMTLRTLRVELSEVTSAQEALASAGVRLAEARARVSGRVSQLLVSLSALGVELPADVRSAVGELASSKGERLKRAKVPCPECGKECEEGRGMANHRRVMHGVTLTNAGRGAVDVDVRAERILSLCTGAGGLDLGVRLAIGAARTVCCVEHEASAVEVLATRMEAGRLDKAPVWSDLRTFDGGAWRGRISGVVGGYPCQPFSVAGKRLGADDPRHLWPDVARIVRECEPEWCFFENVRGHVRLGLREVRSELQGMGYRVHAGLFSAEEVGASHQRERLFILADRSGERGRWLSIRQGESVGSARHAGGSGPEMADPDGGGFRGPRWGHHAAGESDFGRDGEALGDPNDAGRSRRCELHGGDELPAFAPGPEDLRWRAILDVRPGLAPALAQSELRRVVDGLGRGMDLSRAFRLRLTGNGVVPLVAAYAFRTLAAEAGLI